MSKECKLKENFWKRSRFVLFLFCFVVFFLKKKTPQINNTNTKTKVYLTYPYDDTRFKRVNNGRTGEEFYSQSAAVYEDFANDERYKTNWIWLSGLQSWHCHGEGFTVGFCFVSFSFLFRFVFVFIFLFFFLKKTQIHTYATIFF